MKIQRIWSMPNKWTFTIKPIKELLEREVGGGMMMNGLWCDPFCGQNSPAQITNDLNPKNKADFHLVRLQFLLPLLHIPNQVEANQLYAL